MDEMPTPTPRELEILKVLWEQGLCSVRDVYQRLVNANFNLNVHRRALMHNFDDLALDDKARAAMLRFQSDLLALQAQMDSQPHGVWRIYPRDLKVNINA